MEGAVYNMQMNYRWILCKSGACQEVLHDLLHLKTFNKDVANIYDDQQCGEVGMEKVSAKCKCMFNFITVRKIIDNTN